MSSNRVRKPQLVIAQGIAIKVLRKIVEDEKAEAQARILAAQVLLTTPADPVKETT
jgi:hypothetical protein